MAAVFFHLFLKGIYNKRQCKCLRCLGLPYQRTVWAFCDLPVFINKLYGVFYRHSNNTCFLILYLPVYPF